MERIKLSKDEKKVLLLFSKHGENGLDNMPRSSARRALRKLQEKKLMQVAWIEGGDYEAMRITRDGSDYMIDNPKLKNPVDWKWIITTIIAIIGVLATIALLFIACNKLS